MTRERVVIDTNVFISGMLLVTSTPARAVERAIRDGQLLASTPTLRELVARFLSKKFDRYVARDRREALLQHLVPVVEVVEIVQQVSASRDRDDDKFLEVAVNGRGNTIISGDRDLLVLNPFRGIAIVTPAEYVARPPVDRP